MAITLDASADDFESRFGAFLSTKREVSEDVDAAVAARLDGAFEGGLLGVPNVTAVAVFE